MPRVVDHDERRRAIVTACWQVIARSGLEGATTREIAREAGVSHGILAHYFNDKNAILAEALRLSYEELKGRIQAKMAALAGAAALRAVLIEALPANAHARVAEQVELALWGKAIGDAELAAQSYRRYLEWRNGLRDLVQDAQARGELAATANAGVVCDVLVAFVDGLGVQVALYPAKFSARRQIRALDAALGGLGIDPEAARPSTDGKARRPR